MLAGGPRPPQFAPADVVLRRRWPRAHCHHDPRVTPLLPFPFHHLDDRCLRL